MEVTEVVPEFAGVFPFESFNRMQREALPAILDSTANVVASAPTASGKTALAELAIIEAIRDGGTALFIAPLRALTNEKEREWDRFEDLGYSVYVVTGERDLNPRRAERADVLVMTPEKVDSATRKHDSARYRFIRELDCCVIDEAHLLDAERRGSVLEVTIARLRRLCEPRLVALSATMPNIEDVAEWLDAPPENRFRFGEEYRPVELHADVETYATGENAFADKYRRLYRAIDLAEPHLREDGQALVFVASRRDAVRAAETARDELAERDVPVGARGDFDFHTATQVLDNDTLRQSALDGVAFHHAGLSTADKNHVERWFREGTIDLLFSTSTLAWGVNLPARCVVIRDTKHHDPLEGEVDMSPVDILQMLGRAGRPDYDDVGYAWIVCEPGETDRYRELLKEGKPLESRLAEHLDTHLVAEVALGTIRGLDDVMDWLETTFYYVRARSRPEEYGFATLRERVRDTLEGLVERGFLATDDELGLEATTLGRLASRFYLRLATAERFRDLARREQPDTAAVLETVAAAAEFDSVSARQSEQAAIQSALTGVDVDTAGLDAGARKVLAVLRASMADEVPDALQSDAWAIRHNALRLLGALRAFCEEYDAPLGANRASRVAARIEYGVPEALVGLTAIDGVGATRARQLAADGFDDPAAIRGAAPDDLVAAGVSEGVAERITTNARRLPAIEVDWGAVPDRIGRGENDFAELAIRTAAGSARVHVAVTVNGREMTATTAYLDGAVTVPIGVFGADADELVYRVRVTPLELPLAPIEAIHRVVVASG